MEDYDVYRPAFNKKGEVGVALCMQVNKGGATGMFRLAVSGDEPIKIPLKLENFLGVNPLPTTKFELSIHPVNGIVFKERFKLIK